MTDKTKIIGMETLDQAIMEFNGWDGAAIIYFNVAGGYFNSEVFHSDVAKTETYLQDGNYAVFGKDERSGDVKIGDRRREYIIAQSKLYTDGYTDAGQVEYLLAEQFPLVR